MHVRNKYAIIYNKQSCVIIEGIKVEKLKKPETTYNFEVADYHTYYVSESQVLVHNLCERDLNEYSKQIRNNKDIHLKSKDDALELINRKFSNFSQEVAGNRSAQGWHFDYHPINGSMNPVEHINIYSKAQHFRVHITWG